MRSSKIAGAANARESHLTRLRDDEDGATAIEFALISVPFIALLLGLMGVCMLFFTILETENAVWKTSRDLRVGTLQQGNGPYNGLTGTQIAEKFKENICANMISTPTTTCQNNMRVLVQSLSTFGTVTAPNCKDGGGNLIDNATANGAFSAGGASSVVLVTACYKWDLGNKLPFVSIGNLADGSMLVQASFALRTEPYN